MSGPTLTTVLLTKNQAKEVEPLLTEASQWSDQVLLLDDFSDDSSQLRAVARAHNAAILQHELDGDFAAHRNTAFSQISSEWTLFLDADELPQSGFWQELLEMIKSNQYDAFIIKRYNRFLGRQLRYGEAGETKLIRVARTSLGANRWQRAVHEVWELPMARIGTLQTKVEHRQPDSIQEFVAKLNRYAILEQKVRKPLTSLQCLLQVGPYPSGKFFWNYVGKQGFRDGFPGLALAFLMSYYSAIVRIQQYEKTL